jgi:cytochrome P450
MMLSLADAETHQRMSDTEIRDEAIALYLAGYHTTALTLTYAWYVLAEEPEVEARFHDELDRVLGDHRPRLEDLEHLSYTLMIFKEALRLYPPAYTQLMPDFRFFTDRLLRSSRSATSAAATDIAADC